MGTPGIRFGIVCSEPNDAKITEVEWPFEQKN